MSNSKELIVIIKISPLYMCIVSTQRNCEGWVLFFKRSREKVDYIIFSQYFSILLYHPHS